MLVLTAEALALREVLVAFPIEFAKRQFRSDREHH